MSLEEGTVTTILNSSTRPPSLLIIAVLYWLRFLILLITEKEQGYNAEMVPTLHVENRKTS